MLMDLTPHVPEAQPEASQLCTVHSWLAKRTVWQVLNPHAPCIGYFT